MTVSKAMRNAPDISANTKTRIKLLAQQMGYVPDSAAQGLRSRTSRILGLLLPTIVNPVYARMVSAIEESAHEMGYDLIIAHTLNIQEREEACIRRLLARRVDGLFIVPVYRLEPTAPIYNEVYNRRIPTVILGQRSAFCQQFVNVEGDDLNGSYAMTKHLLELGHKRIAFLSGPMASPIAQERLEGYRRALREAGIEVDDKLVFSAGSTIEEGESAALQLINEGTQITAIQAVSDMVAIGAANTFLKQGAKIPDDISITGFGNILTSEHFKVPLTTVRQPKARLGRAAVELMKQYLHGHQPVSTRLSAAIVVRQSTGAPKILA
ncbi:MAG: HTH-type transcriptional regulator DegA [Verrucomicrobiales bacterium]|nr:HTH-type transcriptional regulator DegA [Verrucomicrobiales bacterium]